jgi:hypothetical protein
MWWGAFGELKILWIKLPTVLDVDIDKYDS